MRPLISIIVPAYNAEDYLYNCIKSIENQTYDNIELIIINDGSTDSTAKIIENCQAEFNNIQSITIEDQGVCVSRNTGLSMATGQFLAFVDCDDALRPDTIEILYNAIEENSADVAGCSFSRFSYDSDNLSAVEKERLWTVELNKLFTLGETKVYSPIEYLKDEIFSKNNSRCWSKLYRKTSIENLTFDTDTVIGEDLLFVLSLLSRVNTIVEVNYPGYVYYQNTSGAMLRPFTPKYMGNIISWTKARELATALDSSTAIPATKNLLMAIMLTAGKLSELSLAERKGNSEHIEITHKRLVEELNGEAGQNAFRTLDRGYQLKCRLFKTFPKIYLFLYHFHKYKK